MKKALAVFGTSLALVLPSIASATPVGGNCALATTMTSFVGYLDCRGAFSGNINGSASELTDLFGFGGAWAVSWTWQGKSDDSGNGPFAGGPPGGSTGTINFDAPISGKFVIGIKQATWYSYYLFDEAAPISSIAVSSLGTAPDNPGFSHVALYTTTTTSTVPEPSTYALMATGLIGIFGFARRRRAA